MEEFERRFLDRPVIDDGTIHVIVLRRGDGAHDLPTRVSFDPAHGVIGDRWSQAEHPHPEAQVTLMERRVASLLFADDRDQLHVPGDNLVVDLDLSTDALPVGARLRVGTALLEITAKPHLGCAKFRARVGDEALDWVNAKEHRGRRLRGVNARVVEGGEAALGDKIVRV
ncbi:MAG TPA: MOSC domain-containing protein [Kofleriaceae bacterium]|jgi:MOSC domain-containing protein YiiM|nr:MOSC domain-containing protein [Kofleriaceae bacterium]